MKKIFFIIFIIQNYCYPVYSANFDEIFKLEKLIVLEPNREIGNMRQLIVDENDNLVFVDYHAHNVFIFTQDGKFIKMLGCRGKGPGEFESPLSAVCDSEGRLFICDNGLRKMSIFNADYVFQKSFFIVGSHFMPDNFKILPNTDLIMAGYFEDFSKPFTGTNLELYSSQGKLLKSFEPVATIAYGNALAYYSTSEIDIDSKGNIYSIQATNPEILKYNIHGDLLSKIQLELSGYTKPVSFPDNFFDLTDKERKILMTAFPFFKDIHILNDRFIIINIATLSSMEMMTYKFVIDIFNFDGKSLISTIATDYRLLCKRGDYFYFLMSTDEMETNDIPSYKIGKFKLNIRGN